MRVFCLQPPYNHQFIQPTYKQGPPPVPPPSTTSHSRNQRKEKPVEKELKGQTKNLPHPGTPKPPSARQENKRGPLILKLNLLRN